MAHLEKFLPNRPCFLLLLFSYCFSLPVFSCLLMLFTASSEIYCLLRNISSIPRGLPFLNPDIHYMLSPAPAFH